jgi:hypothetical protein
MVVACHARYGIRCAGARVPARLAGLGVGDEMQEVTMRYERLIRASMLGTALVTHIV